MPVRRACGSARPHHRAAALGARVETAECSSDAKRSCRRQCAVCSSRERQRAAGRPRRGTPGTHWNRARRVDLTDVVMATQDDTLVLEFSLGERFRPTVISPLQSRRAARTAPRFGNWASNSRTGNRSARRSAPARIRHRNNWTARCTSPIERCMRHSRPTRWQHLAPPGIGGPLSRARPGSVTSARATPTPPSHPAVQFPSGSGNTTPKVGGS